MLYYTGLRAGDAGTLKKEYIQKGFIVRTQTKTNLKVSIPLHPELKGLDIFNLMPTKGRRNKSSERLKKILKKYGAKGTLHTFRHTFASKLFDLGLGTEDIKLVTGHSTSVMAAGYTHPTMDRIKDVFNRL